jgi:hypothetical protein
MKKRPVPREKPKTSNAQQLIDRLVRQNLAEEKAGTGWPCNKCEIWPER